MIGTTIAHYQITAKLGQGGMGEVYRATDTKLDREVAIKVLPEEFAKHPERLARFEREAKALAKLNHSNIAAIYGFDQHEGQWFLVLELVEGEDLSQRLKRGPMPVDEALNVFQQIAEALEAAHEKGIVHRDLKPANIKIDPQGRVKVLDFGLAKARFSSDTESVDSNDSTADSMAPTITSEFTMPGKVIGTAAYMSPEQSRGQEVDKRTDVWAFGCCLYEALTGKRPFKGQTTSDLLADILRSDPDFTVIPPETPVEVMTLLRRCLEKDPRRRLRYLGDIALTLEDVTSTSRINILPTGEVDAISKHPARPSDGSWWGKLLVLFGAVVGMVLIYAAVEKIFTQPQGSPQQEPTQSARPIRSIAVLKIEPIGSDSNLTVLANGLEADIRQQLRRIEALEKHPASRSVEMLASSEKNDKEIATELGVDALVYGDLARDGNEIRLDVSLVSVVHGPEARALWETNITSANPKALESRLVLSLLDQFDVPLDSAERSFLDRGGNVSIEAYVAYRKGLAHGDLLTATGSARAKNLFEQAREYDKKFLPPYIQLAWTHWLPTIWGNESFTAQQAFERAYQVLDDAEREFPGNLQIELTRAYFGMISDFDFEQSKRVFNDALLHSPDDPDFNFMYVWYLLFVEGRYPYALRLIDRALATDPERVAFLDAKAEVHAFMNDERASLRINAKIAAENPDEFDRLMNMALSYKNLGELPDAIKNAQEAVRISRSNPGALAAMAEIYAADGQTNKARALLQQVQQKRVDGYFAPRIWEARALAVLGDTEQAVQLLRRAHENREGNSFLYNLRKHDLVDILKDRPDYWKLIDDMGYPAFPIGHPFREKEQEMRFGKGDPGSTQPASIRTLAVQSFENAKEGDSESQWLSKTLHEALKLQLKPLDRLEIKPASFEDADATVNGTFVREGDQLQVTVLLVNHVRQTEEVIGIYTKPINNIFQLQNDIAIAVAEEIRNNLSDEERALIANENDIVPEAYIAYRQGLEIYDQFTVEGFAEAERIFQKARALDPNYVDPIVMLANVKWFPTTWGGSRTSPKEGFQQANALLAEAMQLNPTHTEVLLLRAWIAMNGDWNWLTAGDYFRRAVASAPDNPNCHHGLAWYTCVVEGRYADALSSIERAIELDPGRIYYHSAKALMHLFNDDLAEALALQTELYEQKPGVWVRLRFAAQCLLGLGRPEEAQEKALQAVELSGRNGAPLVVLAEIHAASGNVVAVRTILDEMVERSEQSYVPSSYIAWVQALLGRWDPAFDYLESAFEQQESGDFFVMFRLPRFMKLFADQPRYWELMDRLKLPGLPVEHPYHEKELQLRFGK